MARPASTSLRTYALRTARGARRRGGTQGPALSRSWPPHGRACLAGSGFRWPGRREGDPAGGELTVGPETAVRCAEQQEVQEPSRTHV